jgi:hypothetical protein
MKKMFVSICIMGLILMPMASTLNTNDYIEFPKKLEGEFRMLITEWGNNQTIEINSSGNVIWNISGLNIPHDAERLSNGNTLITVYADEDVIEVNNAGDIIWKKPGLNLPLDAERLENGNTIICEYGGQRVIELDHDVNTVWQKTDLHNPHDAERLPNGNTLIAEAELYPDGRVIEIDSDGNIVWQITELNGPVDVEWLSSGNILITEHVGKRVIEVDINRTIVWQKTGLWAPKDAERLPNGNTLIVECGGNRVIEVDNEGNEVWNLSGLNYPVDVEMIYNQPPSVEIINPREGYVHFSGIPLIPTPFNLISDTMSLGGFRLRPVIINATDDFDESEDLIVNVYLNGEYQGNASYCCDWRKHEWFWTGWALGNYILKITVEDSQGEIVRAEMKVFNFCFLP